MRTIKLGSPLNRTWLKVYETIHELPITRFHELQKLALQDIGIGDTMEAVWKHFGRLETMINGQLWKEAQGEMKNLYNNTFFMIERIDIKSSCFAMMIESIDGKPFESVSDEYIDETLLYLSKKGLTIGMVNDVVDEVKKNLRLSLNHISQESTATQS